MVGPSKVDEKDEEEAQLHDGIWCGKGDRIASIEEEVCQRRCQLKY